MMISKKVPRTAKQASFRSDPIFPMSASGCWGFCGATGPLPNSGGRSPWRKPAEGRAEDPGPPRGSLADSSTSRSHLFQGSG